MSKSLESPTRPKLTLKPNSPLYDAGVRMEPPPSLPVQIGIMPTATAAAEPPEDPPGVRSTFHGLRVTPWMYESVQLRDPNSGDVVCPTNTAPAAQPLGLGRGVVGDLVLVEHRRVGVGPAFYGDELLHAHRHTGPRARILTVGNGRVDLLRAHTCAFEVEEAEGVEPVVELLDPGDEHFEQVDRLQLAGADVVGELPRVAFPQLGQAFPRSVATFNISANASSIPPASTSRSPPPSRSAHNPKCSVPS